MRTWSTLAPLYLMTQIFWHYLVATLHRSVACQSLNCSSSSGEDKPLSFSFPFPVLQYHSWIKCSLSQRRENNRSDRQFQNLLIVKQILFVSTKRNVKRTTREIWIPTLNCKGLSLCQDYNDFRLTSSTANLKLAQSGPSSQSKPRDRNIDY